MKRNPTSYLATVAAALVLSFTVALAPLPGTSRAFAQIPVTVTSNVDVVQDIWKGIGWAVAKIAIQSMTKSIVTWINSGYQGEPAFSQNLNRDLRQAGDAIAGKFVEDFFQANIDSPFLSLARDAASVYYLMTSEDALALRLKYTLGNFAHNSTDYIRGKNWKSGGLSGWYGLTRCENDPTCGYFLVNEALANRIDAQTRRFLAEFNAGRGFLAWQGECQLYERDQQSDRAFEQCVANNEINGSNDDCFALLGGGGTSLSDADKCVEYDVLTPGAVVEQTLSETLNSPLEQLELADSVNEIVAAVVSQMVNQVLGGGGLSGLSKPRSSGSNRPIDQATNPNNTGASLAAGFTRTVEMKREDILRFRTAWNDIRTVAVEAQNLCPVTGSTTNLIRAGQIDDVIARADAALSRADAALSELDTVLTLLQGVDGSEPGLFAGSQVASSQRAYEVYQRLLQEGKLVSEAEIEQAKTERNENIGTSLYSMMQEHVDNCD